MTTPCGLPSPFLPLQAPAIELGDVGGKALNLSRLAHAGFNVPNAFIIPTLAYEAFVARNSIGKTIDRALGAVDPESPASLEEASQAITSAFLAGSIEPGFDTSLEIAWRWLGSGPVAVRSSATAEDLPGFSFAGQQATFLNVVDGSDLLKAVVRCWASLWTARAIGYRERNQIGQSEIGLAVVVQNMVPSTASGVLFTANPVNGLRSETVIDATLGLGEALVSGQVDPDHYVVDRSSGLITARALGRKASILRPDPDGGLRREAGEHLAEQAISDKTIYKLTRIGDQIQSELGSPQDVEWATANTESRDVELHILQSRPITSLYPLPAGLPARPVRVLLSFGAVQGLLEPMTPLGQDAIRLIFAGGGQLFGARLTHTSQSVILIAAHRLWADLTGFLRHPLGRRVFERAIGGIEPGSRGTIEAISSDPSVGAGSGRLAPLVLIRVASFFLARALRIVRVAAHPKDKAAHIRSRYQGEVAALEQRSQPEQGAAGSLSHAIQLYRELENAFVYAVPEIAVGAFVGLFPLLPLGWIAQRLTGDHDLALEITRGLPNNVTTEMDLALWESARSIQQDPGSRIRFEASASQELAIMYLAGELPDPAQSALADFLERYGMRGVGEIDIGRPRWREDPAPLIQTLQSYLKIEPGPSAPDAVFRRGEQAAEEAIQKLREAARRRPFGRLLDPLICGAARRVRALAGLRESPKFYIIQVMGVVRRALQRAGSQLVEEGVLEAQDDIFYLYLDELETLADSGEGGWKPLIEERKEQHRQERMRTRIPRVLLSDGRAFYEGMQSAAEMGDGLLGSGVSPGSVEGLVRVVLDPHRADLQPGEIMVCPATDPAWTPLFLAAGGLVMEMGGMMTHGAIVAREYGIPAIAGVDRATERLKTGERIEMDGSSGRIVRVSDKDGSSDH